jgi:4-carboxymuconolactone decarboxylase
VARIPQPKPEELSAEQRHVYDQILATRGNLDGPFAIWVHSPEMANRAQALGEYVRYHTVLPGEGRLSEMAILMVGRYHDCQVEWSIHEPIARAKGLDSALIDALRNGQIPAKMAEDEAALYHFVAQLLNKHVVDAATFAEARTYLGEQGLVDLTALVGYYSFVCMTLNAFEVDLPPHVEPDLPGAPIYR